MARKAMVIGYSGSGKTRSLINLDPKETFYICPDEKEMSFPGGEANYVTRYKKGEEGKKTVDLHNSNRYETTNPKHVYNLLNTISKDLPHIKVVVIDTITSMMTDDFMSRAEEKGWEKFTEMAKSPYQILKRIRKLRDDLIVVVMAHSEDDGSDSNSFTKMFIPGGKLLKEKAVPEAQFSVVLETVVEYDDSKESSNYYFRTQNRGDGIAKSPEGMFDDYLIRNDMKMVVDRMQEYYGITEPEKSETNE